MILLAFRSLPATFSDCNARHTYLHNVHCVSADCGIDARRAVRIVIRKARHAEGMVTRT